MNLSGDLMRLIVYGQVRVHRKLRDDGVVTDLVAVEGISPSDYFQNFNVPESKAAFNDLKKLLVKQVDN